MSMNRVVLTGGLTRDPEVKATSGGMSILSLRLAFSSRGKNPQTGQWEDMPNYIDVTMFGDRAARIAPHLKKGSSIGVDGKLRWREWEKDGQKRQAIEVIADDIEFVGGRSSDDAFESSRPVSSAVSSDDVAGALGAEEVPGEEIPF